MKKNTKIYLFSALIIIAIIVLIYFIKNYNSEELTESQARCISEKSIVYSQTGCHHCIAQKKKLGNFTSFFNIIECDKEPEKCSEVGIRYTPTWIINQKKYEGLQTIKQLKELTGC